MNVRQAAGGLLLLAAHTAASACDLPRLVAIPEADRLGEGAAQLLVRVQAYVAGIRTYSVCVQDELAGAGGDAAPESLRKQLIGRNNAAVAEARAVLALFSERVAPAEDLYLADFVTGEGNVCIPTQRLRSTSVINDLAVLFIERDGRAYLNVLEESCDELERSGNFDVRRNLAGSVEPGLGMTQLTRLCSNQFIEPYAFETTTIRKRSCALGPFFELTEQRANELMELRAAARPAAPEPVAAGDRATETPTPPRTER